MSKTLLQRVEDLEATVEALWRLHDQPTYAPDNAPDGEPEFTTTVEETIEDNDDDAGTEETL